MEFAPQQAKAVDDVAAWLKDPGAPQVFRLFGYAGSGKTTLAMHLAAQQDKAVAFAAFTGKAASVLQKKGCPATTIHGLIYELKRPNEQALEEVEKKLRDNPHDTALQERRRELARPRFVLRDGALDDFGLVVIDECSMVGEDIGADLLSFGKKILVLGDPAQLPPVQGGGFFTDHTPDILLTEVHRQARGSPVINLATLVRQGNRIKLGGYGTSRVQRRDSNTTEQLASADQVLVGTNKTRERFNSLVRDSKGLIGVVPQVGEKLICLRNDKDLGLLNGTQWEVLSAKDDEGEVLLKLRDWGEPEGRKVECAAHPFDLDVKSLPYRFQRSRQEFTFGYAITCHKSQGSQWENVFIQDESWCFREHAQRWLYTAITRAADRVTIAI